MLIKQRHLTISFSAFTLVGLFNSLPAKSQIVEAEYLVPHNFTINFGGNAPNVIGARIAGKASCFPPQRSDNYGPLQIFDTIPPLSVNLIDETELVDEDCKGSLAFADSIANGSMVGNILTGTTEVFGFADAFNPPGGVASASSEAAIVAGQLTINPFGQIIWQPQFLSSVSGSAFSVSGLARIRDPILFDIVDPNTENTLFAGTFLNITGEHNGVNSELEWGTDELNINFVDKGFFRIEIPEDVGVINPGLFDLTCEVGEISSFDTTGRFAGISGLPNPGDVCSFSIPFNADFPNQIVLDYDFTGLVPTTEVALNFDLGGGGEAIVAISVPEPSSTGSLFTLGILLVSSTTFLRYKQ